MRIKRVFRKAMENMKLRDIKLLSTERRINDLESESNYHTTKCFSENHKNEIKADRYG